MISCLRAGNEIRRRSQTEVDTSTAVHVSQANVTWNQLGTASTGPPSQRWEAVTPGTTTPLLSPNKAQNGHGHTNARMQVSAAEAVGDQVMVSYLYCYWCRLGTSKTCDLTCATTRQQSVTEENTRHTGVHRSHRRRHMGSAERRREPGGGAGGQGGST